MAPATATVQHRSSTKHSHKPFKSRHATKSQIKDSLKGRIESERGVRNKKPLHQQVMSKIERRHKARQQRQNKHREHAQTTSVFAGRNGAPRIVAVVPLTPDIDNDAVVESLATSIDIDVTGPGFGAASMRAERFKQSIRFVKTTGELFSSLNACMAADFVVIALSASEDVGEDGQLLLRTIESQGVSSIVSVVQGLENIEAGKKRTQALQTLKSFISQYFPDQEKITSLGSASECSNVMRSICTSVPKGIHWRDDRSWMLVDDLEWSGDISEENCEAVLTGVVRGRPMKANRLLQVGDWGEFQVDKITILPTGDSKLKQESMAVDDSSTVELPGADQDTLEELAPEDLQMQEAPTEASTELPSERKGVLLDDHHYFSEEEDISTSRTRRLPKGTSAYQAAWFLDDMSDSGSDMEDMPVEPEEGDEAVPQPEDGMEGLDTRSMPDATEADPSEYPRSEAFQDRSAEEEAQELAAYRAKRKAETSESGEFPDEIELPPQVLARERLARYRGLKSLRTSRWQTDEDRPHQPAEWDRLLHVPNYAAARSQATREALVGGVPLGSRVQIHLRNVPSSIRHLDQHRVAQNHPLTAVSLLRHEHKRSVTHYMFNLRNDQAQPVKSKTEIVVQCGARRFVAHPIFSAAETTPNDVHKFERYLEPGQSAIASITGPVTWGSVPTLFFARTAPTTDATSSSAADPSAAASEEPLKLIATGTTLPPSQARVVAKRIILTGHPYRINKRLVTIRYMFFNNDDVRWFAALPLWTRRGRSGFIKEPLGTHGVFKATFDGKINAQDAVGVSLYKRVWPRWSRAWGLEERVQEEKRREDKVARERERAGIMVE